MRKIYLLLGMLVSLHCLSQPYIQGSIQKGTSCNETDIMLLPNYTSGPTEYIQYLSISVAIPTASAAGVTNPTITGVNNLAGVVFSKGTPFSYTAGTETIYSWICNNLTVQTMSWTSGVPFKVATITFAGGSGSSKIRLVDFSNVSGGDNGNTLFFVVTTAPPFDVTNYSDFFYAIPDPNGSTEGTYANGDKYVETNLPICLTNILCQQPATPVVSIIGTTSADISWNPVSGAAGYEYEVTTSPTPTIPGTATGSPNYPATGLTPATLYYVYVRTNCGGGLFSGWSSTSFTTEAINCTTPALPVVTNISSTGANINWNSSSSAVNYEYVLDNSSAAPVTSGTPTTDTFYYPPNLTPGTVYYIHIRSNCGFGYYSNWVTVPFTTICPAPAISGVSNISSTGADINWNPVAGVTGYEYAIDMSFSPPGSGTSTTGTSYPAAGLNPGTNYYFHVRSECSPGIFSTWTNTLFTTICPAPPIPSVTAITSNSATINWAAVSGVGLYQYAVITSSTPPASGTTIAYTTTPVTGLLPGTVYYVYVRSECSPGIFSAWSLTTFNTLCLPPLSITIDNISTTADISWIGQPVSISYEYVIKADSTQPAGGTFTTGTSYHAPGLNSYTTYYVFVRNVCNPGIYSPWIRRSFTTGCFRPSPFILSNSAITGTADLGWYKVHGAINYEYAILSTEASPLSGSSTTDDTVLHVSGLKAGAKYYLHIRTRCSPVDLSDWSILPFFTSGIAVYPNPVNGMVTVRVFGLASNGEIVIYDAIGRRVRLIKLAGNSATIDTGNLAAGVYFVRYGNNKKYVTSMIKL